FRLAVGDIPGADRVHASRRRQVIPLQEKELVIWRARRSRVWSILVGDEIPGTLIGDGISGILRRDTDLFAIPLQFKPGADLTGVTRFAGRIIINPNGTRALYSRI